MGTVLLICAIKLLNIIDIERCPDRHPELVLVSLCSPLSYMKIIVKPNLAKIMKKSINNICRTVGAIAVSDELWTYARNLLVFCWRTCTAFIYIFRPDPAENFVFFSYLN